MTLLYLQVLILYFGLIYLLLQFKNNHHKRAQVLCQGVHTKKVHSQLLWALGLMIFALSRPVLPDASHVQKSKGYEATIALDLSYSMQAKDIQPTRYEAAVSLIKTVLKRDLEDRFSLFGFTTHPLIRVL